MNSIRFQYAEKTELTGSIISVAYQVYSIQSAVLESQCWRNIEALNSARRWWKVGVSLAFDHEDYHHSVSKVAQSARLVGRRIDLVSELASSLLTCPQWTKTRNTMYFPFLADKIINSISSGACVVGNHVIYIFNDSHRVVANAHRCTMVCPHFVIGSSRLCVLRKIPCCDYPRIFWPSLPPPNNP